MTDHDSLLGFVLISGMMFSSCSATDREPGLPEENIKSPDVPCIDFVVMSEVQSHQNDPNVIWYDDMNSGGFSGSLKGRTNLSSENTYFCRVRQKSTNGEWSNWSRWHQNFKVVN